MSGGKSDGASRGSLWAMTTPTAGAAASAKPGAPSAALPELTGRCYRCGNPTRSPDVGLCEECNPTGIAGPTATQVHGLILGAVAGALIVIALAAKLLVGPSGPFPASVAGQAAYPDGSIDVVVSITNSGTSTARPTCTIVRGPQDAGVDFLADPIGAGASTTVTKHVAPPPAGPTALATVSCH
jgi:hypothetical protein